MSILRHPPPFVPPIVTGEDLARAAAADFESFFLTGGEVPIRIEVKAINAAITKGIGGNTRIVIPREMAREVIDTPDKLFFHLLILGHEIAHVVHHHNDEVDQQRDDFHALEMWADFYGAKVMMCLVTFGPRIGPKFKSFYPGSHFLEPALESMGQAAERLVTGVYANHPRYPYPLLRVGLVNNGVTSFLRREMKNAPGIWPFSVFKRLFASTPVRELMILHPEHMDPDFEPVERARRWHLAIQGADIAIAPWLKPWVVHHLHTSFQQTDEEREASRMERVRELREAGLLPAENGDEQAMESTLAEEPDDPITAPGAEVVTVPWEQPAELLMPGGVRTSEGGIAPVMTGVTGVTLRGAVKEATAQQSATQSKYTIRLVDGSREWDWTAILQLARILNNQRPD